MDFHLTLYNGFNIGLERKVNSPCWMSVDGGYEVYFFRGIEINIGFIRLRLGSFLDPDEFIDELEGS